MQILSNQNYFINKERRNERFLIFKFKLEFDIYPLNDTYIIL